MDIANIDHEAIQNDFQIRGKDPIVFKKKRIDSFIQHPNSFFFIKKNRLVDELEDIANVKEEEMLFMSSLHQSQLDTPMLSPSYAIQINGILQDQTSEDPLHQVLDDSNTNTEQEKLNWSERIVLIFYQLLRECLFLLFMRYWIVKKPVIRTVTLFTMIVSTLIVNPLLFLWSTLPANENWMPSPVTRKRITSGMTFIVFLLI